MELEQQQRLLAEYQSQEPTYQALTETVVNLLTRLLRSAKIQVHSITGRTKDRVSVAGKLARPDKGYDCLEAITDLAGVRITTYFADDVDRVASLFEREFDVDSPNSVDKRRAHAPDRFGYMSLHYVGLLSSARSALSEYSQFAGKRFEVQIRSILQHAWAEMEHDLGYKTATGVPQNLRRRFARLAGLLEIADDEFCQIRDALQVYKETVLREIKSDADNVELNQVSIGEFIVSDPVAQDLDRRIALVPYSALHGAKPPHSENLLKRLAILGVSSIGELQRHARDNLDLTAAFADVWLSGKVRNTRRGIGIFFLCYVLGARTGDKHKVGELFKVGGVDDSDGALVRRVFEAYEEAVALSASPEKVQGDASQA